MKTIITIIAAMLLITICKTGYTQTNGVGINATGATPAPSAMLDVSSASSGLLIPRMTEVQKLSIASPATGLMVYQTDGANPGFWHYDGSNWIQSIGITGPIGATGPIGPTGANGALNAWGLAGNAGTDSTVNFVGTTDAEALVLKTSNSERVRVNKVGRVGIGTAAPDPSALLDIKSTTNGVLIPRMNTAQRNAIASPATGLQVFNTDCNGLNYYTGTCWLSVSKTLPNPGAITSNPTSTDFCAGQSRTYSIAAVTGASSYLWTVPAGATITSGQGSISVNVTFGNNSGNVCVSASNACETTGQSCLTVNIAPILLASAGPNLQYYSSSCSAVTIGGNPTAAGGIGNYVYSWSPATGLSSATIANPTANPTATTTYSVTITSGGCSSSSSMTFSVATGGTLTFNYTGTPQTWIVPAGVTCINITASGATGGKGYYSGNTPSGGSGGTVTGIKLVTPGTVLTINVGQQGGSATSSASGTGGINGGGNGGCYSTAYCGGGGGGASDVMLGGTALLNRIIVGGGGGGGGAGNYITSTGGIGGYPSGANGLYNGSFNSYCGAGGTVFSGGSGATYSSYPGIAGGLGYGGNANGTGGGGGGGGYYGGGGGGPDGYNYYIGGGGGGASYFGGMSSNTNNTNGNTSGNGSVIISW